MSKKINVGKISLVASSNTNKIIEIQNILGKELGTKFEPVKTVVDYPDPEENELTFEGNALIKAQKAFEETGYAVIADDSGLVVDALDGKPGVFSARYAKEHDDEANNKKLLEELDRVGAMTRKKRKARFVASIALIDKNGEVYIASGTCDGSIALEPRGENGFGYDPLFIPSVIPDKTMAELTSKEKNKISHRAQALNNLLIALGKGEKKKKKKKKKKK